MPEEPDADSTADQDSSVDAIDIPGAEWPEPPKRPARSRLRSPLSPPPGSTGPGSASGRGKGFPWRFILYGIFVLYLVSDFLLFDGPLKRRYDSRQALSSTSAENAIRYGWVATINGVPITTLRLERAVDIHLYQRGKTLADLSASNLRHVRGAVLQRLIDDQLVEQYAAGQKYKISSAEVDAAVARFESQFKDAEQLQARSAAQHLDADQRRERLRQLATQTDWLELHLQSSPQVTEALARQWYEDNREGGAENGFVVDEAFHARHIFISTVTDDSPEREEKIRELHRQLSEDDADFATLAAENSEDQRSKPVGGDLNWFSQARMPEDFIDAIADLQPGDLSQPFRSRIGWHIVELIDKHPARDASFEEMRDEIIAYLETEDRRQKIDEFVKNLRKTSIIQVFPEQL